MSRNGGNLVLYAAIRGNTLSEGLWNRRILAWSGWDLIRETSRLRHLSLRTEQAYLAWIRRFWLFHKKRKLRTLGTEEIRAFLSHLAAVKHVSASTQNQALCAILFLYRDVLKVNIPSIEQIEKAKRHRKIPVVFTHSEALAVLNC